MTVVPEVSAKLTSTNSTNLAQILCKTNYFMGLFVALFMTLILINIKEYNLVNCYSYTFLCALIIFCQAKSLAPKLTKSGLSKLSL